ncbi:MAG: lipopolysaccharide kinase InaA family protein [Tepidisphaeraceae bacterium]|jgi:hypothetical protein
MPRARAKSRVDIQPKFQALFAGIGFEAEMVFSDPRIKCWRHLSDRENCTWDLSDSGGETIRLHVKRYFAGRTAASRARQEAEAADRLAAAHVPAASIAAWGVLADGRSFVILEDLAGYQAADQLIESGVSFDRLLDSTADLAAALHGANLHHRDLYLCHFFAKLDGGGADVRLIDLGRVGPLPILTRRRWIVKDLAQFWYSTLALPITDLQREAWLERYAAAGGVEKPANLRRSIELKSKSIAAHDAKLRRRQPGRNISIPKN